MNGVGQFLGEVKSEFDKIIWPKTRELIGSVSVVLLLVAVFSIYLGLIDFILFNIAQRIF